MSVEHDKLNKIFSEALAQASPEERERYLAGVCGSDQALREQIDSLIEAHAQSGDFLRRSVVSRTGTLVDERISSIIGRYKLRESLGEGGCGVVYVAEQEEPVRRKVALKVIKLGMDTRSVVARFEAERQALALMDHPNIAKVLEAGATEAGRPYFVMELVRGLRITDYCDQHQLSTGERLELFIQVCRAVQHAHQKGIIHRDLKPSNILVTVNDGAAVPKVIDFGIAKATEGRLTDKTVYTELHQFIGTPAYMSPEQAELTSVDIDTRSDIYSLGVLLYELLTGGTPFDQRELLKAGLDTMRQTIRAQEPPRPSTRLSTLGAAHLAGVAQARRSEPPKLIHLLRGDLDWIVMKCLEKDRARRYETANGLAMDLQRHLNNEPVAARPPSATYQIRKFIRRNRVIVTAAAAVGAALVLGTFVSTWQAIRATQAKRQSEANEQKARMAQANEARERGRAEADEKSAQRLLYDADMRLAQEAWEQSNGLGLHELLDETVAYPARGFEWYYWQRQMHRELKTLFGHTDAIHSVAFSPDGLRIVTGSWDWTAKVWDVASGQELHTLKGHSSLIHSAVFSPDGGRIATGSEDTTAKVWDAASGQEQLTLKGHRDLVSSVSFSPDGRRIVTGSKDATAKVWDASTGEELLTLKGHSNWVNSAVFSPDGRRIVTSSDDKTAKVWDAASGQELLSLVGKEVDCAVYSPDGRRILTGSMDQATIWDATDGGKLLTLVGHRNRVWSACFSPDSRWVLTGSGDQTARVWDAADGRELLSLLGHRDHIWSAMFSPDGQQIVTGSGDRTAKVWEANGGNQPLTLKGPGGAIRAVTFSPEGRRIAVASDGGIASVWEATTGKELLAVKASSGVVDGVAFSPDGQSIATGNSIGPATVWDLSTGNKRLTLDQDCSTVGPAAFSPDGQRIVTSGRGQVARVSDAPTGRALLALKGHRNQLSCAGFSPDGRRIVTSSEDHTARVWNATDGTELLTLTGHSQQVWFAAFSPDGRRIVTASGDRTAKVWDSATGQELLTLKGHGGEVVEAIFSPDGRRVLTGGIDGTAKVWDSSTGKELLSLKGQSSWVGSVSCSPDGQRIVTAGGDQTAMVWEAATAHQVDVWQREERRATEGLTVARRDQRREQWASDERERALRAQDPEAVRQRALRAQDPGAIKEWLVLAPIPFAGGGSEGSGAVALAQEQIPREAELRPHAGDKIKAAQGELAWKAVRLEDYLIDFNHLVGDLTEWSVAYAVCYIQSETDLDGLSLHVGSDDQSKIYLNGREIYRNDIARPWVPDGDLVPGQQLRTGQNVVVFKLVNEFSGWQGSVRFTDAAGEPVKGISVSLTPP